MHYLGLTPSEYSSGARRQQGSITKAWRQNNIPIHFGLHSCVGS
jgi:transposase